MPTETAASYLPDCQVITLKPSFAAFGDPENLRGIQGPDEIGFFFHEWIHYLHNVSTIQGLSAFANLVHLWSSFRNTIGADGLSAGSAVLSEELALNIRQKVIFMTGTRGPRRNQLPPGVHLSEIEVLSASRSADTIEGTAFEASTINCQVAIQRAAGTRDVQVIAVGTREILESVAFMLEDRLTLKLGSAVRVASVDPYLLVRMIASHAVPGISDDLALLCALSSLQDSDPPSVLLDILRAVRDAMNRDEDPLSVLGETQLKVLRGSEEWAEARLQEVERMFPNDEPMARAVKSTTKTIRQNFAFRRESPFLELSVIDRVAANPSALSEIVKTYGACAVIQQRQGLPDDIDRDLMYDFVLAPSHDEELSFGWRMMHAAFRFVVLHCTKDEVLATESLPRGARFKCPFYTACSFQFRRDRSDDCATQPWLAATSKIDELCWYGRAVRTLKPRPSDPAALAD